MKGIHNPRQQLFYHIWQLQVNKLKSFQFSHKSTMEIIAYTVVSLQKRELGYMHVYTVSDSFYASTKTMPESKA